MSSTENAGKTMLTTDLKTNYDPETNTSEIENIMNLREQKFEG